MTPKKLVEQIRSILAHSGYKIFTPSWRYCRLRPAFLAVRYQSGKESAYLIKVQQGRVLIGWLQPDRHDPAIHEELKEKFGSVLKFRPRLMYPFRLDNWDELHELITPNERDEFKKLIYGTRLS